MCLKLNKWWDKKNIKCTIKHEGSFCCNLMSLHLLESLDKSQIHLICNKWITETDPNKYSQ